MLGGCSAWRREGTMGWESGLGNSKGSEVQSYGDGFVWGRSAPTCERRGLAQGAVVRGGEGPCQAGTEGCRRGSSELLAQQPPLGVVGWQLPEAPLQRLPKEPQLLVGLCQLLLSLQWEGRDRAGAQLGVPLPRLSPTWDSFSLEVPKPKPSWSCSRGHRKLGPALPKHCPLVKPHPSLWLSRVKAPPLH